MAFPMVHFIPNCFTLSYGIPCQPTATLYTGFLILLTLKNVTYYNTENHLHGESIIVIGSYTEKIPPHLMS